MSLDDEDEADEDEEEEEDEDDDPLPPYAGEVAQGAGRGGGPWRSAVMVPLQCPGLRGR
jgi:hypothetical protein